mgnify:FL=1
MTEQVNKKWNNKEKSYYANITKHLNRVYKSVELDIDNICSILEHMGNDGKQEYTTNYAILPIGYWIKGKNAIFFPKKRMAYQNLKIILLHLLTLRG